MPSDTKVKRKSRFLELFNKNPELKKKVEASLKAMSASEKKENFEKFKKFAAGEVTWAELKGYPKVMLLELAQLAYDHYRIGEYEIAESIFKGLSVLDHLNWYYRSALGAIYQKQKNHEQAIEEYSVALRLNENDLVSLTNRGECFLSLQNYAEALRDFEAVLALDKTSSSPWTRRAVVLKKKIIDEGHAP